MLFATRFIINQTSTFRTLISLDFRKKYFGTLLGASWALISPLLTISLIYFVFHYGFKATHVGNVNFLSWLIAGMLPWLYISEGINNSSHAFIENKHLITKIKFPIRILPTVKITSPLITHFILIFIFILFQLLQSEAVKLSSLPYLIYFIFCSFSFLQSLSLLVATVAVFVKDTANVIQIALQLLYWVTPIFWSPDLLPSKFIHLMNWNPLYYIIEGYRLSFFSDFSFSSHLKETIIFWVITLIIFIFGKALFKKLSPHFSDVL